MATPYSIRIFLPSGEPNGLRIMERANWTGVGVVFSRSGFQEAIRRGELAQAGVYLLFDRPEDGSLPTVYIGEGDPVPERLKSHYSDPKKAFWEFAVVFSAKDKSLNKAHIQYLESRLVSLAKERKLCRLENGNMPQLPSLAESDQADTELFLGYLRSILPLAGLDIFEKPNVGKRTQANRLHLRSRKIDAEAVQTSEGFVVLVGSQASMDEADYLPDSWKRRRAALLENGVLKREGDFAVFTEDVRFTSPSYAASVILGRNANGLDEWKNADNLSLKALSALAATVEESGKGQVS